METLLLEIEYDGSRYSGWSNRSQKGTGSRRPCLSVKFQALLFRLTGEEPELFCGAKTAPGVHALKQTVSFCTSCSVSPQVLKKNMNLYLPQDIAVLSIQKMQHRFNASLQACSRTWLLRLHKASKPDIFRRTQTWTLPHFPDPDRMKAAFQILSGRHDFRNFTTARKKKPAEKELFSLDIIFQEDEMHLFLSGSDFLPNMAGILLRLLVDIGLGYEEPDCIESIFRGTRSCPPPCPAQALFLADVCY